MAAVNIGLVLGRGVARIFGARRAARLADFADEFDFTPITGRARAFRRGWNDAGRGRHNELLRGLAGGQSRTLDQLLAVAIGGRRGFTGGNANLFRFAFLQLTRRRRRQMRQACADMRKQARLEYRQQLERLAPRRTGRLATAPRVTGTGRGCTIRLRQRFVGQPRNYAYINNNRSRFIQAARARTELLFAGRLQVTFTKLGGFE